MEAASKIFQTFWRIIYFLPAAIKSKKTEFLLSFPIRFTSVSFAILAKFTKANTSQYVSKKIFDRVQEVLKERGKPQKSKNEPQPFCGLLHCGSCGMMVTGEYKVKKQKNGNIHEYIYYHCSKRSKIIKCPEPCIRQEELDKPAFLFAAKIFFESRLGG